MCQTWPTCNTARIAEHRQASMPQQQRPPSASGALREDMRGGGSRVRCLLAMLDIVQHCAKQEQACESFPSTYASVADCVRRTHRVRRHSAGALSACGARGTVRAMAGFAVLSFLSLHFSAQPAARECLCPRGTPGWCPLDPDCGPAQRNPSSRVRGANV